LEPRGTACPLELKTGKITNVQAGVDHHRLAEEIVGYHPIEENARASEVNQETFQQQQVESDGLRWAGKVERGARATFPREDLAKATGIQQSHLRSAHDQHLQRICVSLQVAKFDILCGGQWRTEQRRREWDL